MNNTPTRVPRHAPRPHNQRASNTMTKWILSVLVVLLSLTAPLFGGERTVYRPALAGLSITNAARTETVAYTDDMRLVGYVQGRATSIPDEYGRTYELAGMTLESKGTVTDGTWSAAVQTFGGTPSVTAPDDETVGTLPATSDQDEPAVTTWTESHGTHTIKTHQLVNESDDKWAQRHARRVEALQRVYPPIPPTDH